jgi:hypothetical protein
MYGLVPVIRLFYKNSILPEAQNRLIKLMCGVKKSLFILLVLTYEKSERQI